MSPSPPERSLVTSYCRATERNDLAEVMRTLSPDAELVSPLSGRMVFRGAADLEHLLGAVYGSLRDLRWTEQIDQGASSLVIGHTRVGPFRLGDAMVLDLAPDGRIRRIRPHLRPWLATTWFALKLGPKVARRPGVVWRALHGA